jgi:hypothetical protein
MLGSLLTTSTGALRERSYARTGSGASLGFVNPFIETTSCRALAFWLRRISFFHRSRDDGTYDDSLALTLLIFPWPFAPIETMGLLAFAPCLRRFHCLPPTRAESRTSLRRDRERCASGIKSNHLERPHVAPIRHVTTYIKR